MVALATVLFFLVCPRPAIAHDPLLDLPEPKSVPEAWDVIRQSVENVGKLLETNQLKPIAFQIANCSPAIRRLQSELGDRADRQELREKLEAMYASGGSVILATRDKQSPLEKAQALYKTYKAAWDAIAERYPPELRTSAVYNCPMHPLDRHLKETDRCTICSMKLNRRRIPSSTTYEKPGAASMTLKLVPTPPLKPGVRSTINAKLARLDGAPVLPADLLVMHTERVHLLIVDSSLADYHHEHPTPTATPGEYEFAITPRLPGEYRVFADVVPGATGVQEYVVGDIPPAEDNCHGNPISDKVDRLSAEDRGLKAALVFPGLKTPTLRANEVVVGELRFTDRDGTPFGGLEPVMGAFAHIVGFAEDRKTVVHIHPQGEEPKTAAERGGPLLKFNFYAPAAGYYRLYVQVLVGGEARFIPLGLNVAGAGK
ncbi:hypothetical protein IPV69_06385 [Humisphaera borealis]|uniref:Secreted protein n=2 Tax=Humisphaera borealis TaxID=2807512 RepID=A0A7M2X002_9BACT|nr:hypothetical protein IPV69_06385 [Humisphaera borealis]